MRAGFEADPGASAHRACPCGYLQPRLRRYCLLLPAICLLPSANCFLLLRQCFYCQEHAERSSLLDAEEQAQVDGGAVSERRIERDRAGRERRVEAAAV